MSVEHVDDKGSVITVTIPDSKTRRQRMFIVTDGTTNNLHLYRTYVSLRPAEISHNRLFLTYRSNRCTVQPVGINTFSKIPSIIATYLNLSAPNLYTGHCFRRSSATMLVAQGGDILTLKRHGDWRSTSVAEGYIDDDLSNKVQVANKILGENKPTTSSIVDNINNSLETPNIISASSFTFPSSSGVINFGGVTNCTINIYHST